MRAGKLRRVVDIETPTTAADGVGEMVPSWGTFAANVYANIEPLSGGERIQAGQINANVNSRVTIRYVDGVTPKMRVKYGSRYFQIVAVQNVDERNRSIELTCLEQL